MVLPCSAKNCDTRIHVYADSIVEQINHRYLQIGANHCLIILHVLASARLFLFPKIKMHMKRKFFADIPTVKVAVMQKLKAVTKENFSGSLQSYEHAKLYKSLRRLC